MVGCEPVEDVGGLSTVVNGNVTDWYTQVGIMGVPIIIVDEDSEADFWEMRYTYFDTVYTNSLGYYRYEFVNKVGRYYYVNPLSTDLYFNNQKWTFSIDEGVDNRIDFAYKPYNKLSIQIVNKHKKWSRFYINSGDSKIIILHDFGYIKADTIIETKFVPDIKTNLGIYMDNDKYGIADEYKYEKYSIPFYCGNRDTSVYIEY
jgi:hypothetical protein